MRALDRTQHVRLGDVRDFVGQHRSDFVLAIGRQDQAGVDRDVTAERGERVDLALPEQEERERLVRLVAGRAEPVAQRLQPFAQ